MNPVLFALALALVWAALTGGFSLPNLLLGLAIGVLALLFFRDRLAVSATTRRIVRAVALALFFLRELVSSAIRVGWLVISPNLSARIDPGFIVFPLRVQGDGAIALLANLVTLTPGTLSVDVSPDRKTLLIHALEASDPAKVIRSIADGFERRVIEVFK